MSKKQRNGKWWMLQEVFFIGILTVPFLERNSFFLPVRFSGAAFLLLSFFFSYFGAKTLGENLKVAPEPKEGNCIVRTGVYGITRHPMYTGSLLFGVGYSLLMSSFIGLGITVLLFFFLDYKASSEEKMLLELHFEYADYKRNVRKLIPWIY